MRLKSIATAVALVMLLAGMSWAGPNPTQVTWNFNTPTGKLGTSQTYMVDGITLTAYGFSSPGHSNKLFGKKDGGDESGLGLYGFSDDEIGGNGFIQLNLTQLLQQYDTAYLTIGSVQQGEYYDVWLSNTLGRLGTEVVSNGTLDDVQFPVTLLQSSPYLGISAGRCGNVLLSTLSVNQSQTPEPASLALFGSGLILAAMLFRRRSRLVGEVKV
jgi:PEP-CTERM motif